MLDTDLDFEGSLLSGPIVTTACNCPMILSGVTWASYCWDRLFRATCGEVLFLVLVALRLLYSCPRKSASAAAVSLHFQTSALVEKTGN